MKLRIAPRSYVSFRCFRPSKAAYTRNYNPSKMVLKGMRGFFLSLIKRMNKNRVSPLKKS